MIGVLTASGSLFEQGHYCGTVLHSSIAAVLEVYERQLLALDGTGEEQLNS
jgi:hypothetical protein